MRMDLPLKYILVPRARVTLRPEPKNPGPGSVRIYLSSMTVSPGGLDFSVLTTNSGNFIPFQSYDITYSTV